MSPKKTQSGIFAPSELLGRIERTITIGNGSNNITIVTECRQNDKSVLHALLVSSDAMARASQVWRRMFEGEWVEACKDERPVLDYREDSHTAVMTLMNIIHIQFGQVPSTLTLSELRKIAIFSDKWFLTAVLEPWVQRWVEQLSILIDAEGHEPDWLWIAWEFGITAVFNRVGARLAFGAPIPEAKPASSAFTFPGGAFGAPIPETKPASSAFTSPGGAFGVSRPQVSYLNELSKVNTVSSFSSMALPPGVEESITRMRERMIECMLTGLYEYSEALIDWVNDPNPSVSSPQLQRCAHSKRDCVALQFGSLTLGLSEDLWPRRDAKDVSLSPAQLRTRLLDIQLSDCKNNDFKQTIRDGRLSSKQAKVYCGDFGKILKRIEDVPFQQPPFANDMQLNHLTDRFAIVGISCDFVPVPIFRKQKTGNRINLRS
nr:nuclear pore protein [Colletotrichum truncatum]KAF6794037.1 nuclear pore protein [Colletotrichum truncatum]